jgi:hypothetical protein
MQLNSLVISRKLNQRKESFPPSQIGWKTAQSGRFPYVQLKVVNF